MTVLPALGAYFRRSMAIMFHYRGEIVLWAVWGVVYPAVGIAMWSAAVAGNANGQDIGGFGAKDFAAYFLMNMVVGHFCTAWDVYEMGYLIRSGTMSPKLLRPLLPIWEALADNLAFKVLTLAVLLPTWVLVAWLSEPRFDLGAGQLALGIIAQVLAAALNFIWGYTVATLSFWITRMDHLGELWFGLSLFVGGRLGPLTILPWPLQWGAAMLPFKWVIWFPSMALTGKLPAEEIAWGLLWQTCWLIAGLAAFRLIWKTALKRYSAVGG